MNTNEQIALLRNNILLQLNTADPASLPLSALTQGAGYAGFKIDECAIKRELRYLQERKLISSESSRVNTSLKRYRIAADGRDYLAEVNLA